ncbi:MAG: TetR/AcrR family transcriptional regulator [Actinobacteria bacterium]|nr:TetR/AcrR family transcriptional regulator [Actinomycetota bacterium]
MSREPAKRPGDEERPFTTEAADGSLRRRRSAQRDELSARLRTAALELAGEKGYAALSVQKIIDRSGVGRSAFYSTFADKEECFLVAYGAAALELEQSLLDPCREAPDWLTGFVGSLAVLAALLAERPAWAAGVLAEVQVAGGAAGTVRKEVFERLSSAIDAARRETGSRHSPPPTTAMFILAAIESAALRSLRGIGPDFAVAAPDLIYVAAVPYLGAEAAARARRRALRAW